MSYSSLDDGDSSWCNRKRATVVAGAGCIIFAIILGIVGLAWLLSSSKTPTDNKQFPTPTYGHVNFTGANPGYSVKQHPVTLKTQNGSLIIVSQDFTKDLNNVLLAYEDRTSTYDVPHFDYNTVDDFSAHNLGDDHVLVSLRNSNLTGNVTNQVQWKIFIVDTKNSSDSSMTFTKGEHLENIIDILPSHDTFDIVMKYPNDTGLRVFKFDNQGKLVNDFKASIPDEKFRDIHVRRVNDSYQEYSYIVSDPKNANSSVLKTLDDKFKVIQSKEFTHEDVIDEYAYSLDYERFSVCSSNVDRKNFTCIIDKLTVHNLTFDKPIYHVNVVNLLEGGIMMAYAEEDKDKSFDVYSLEVSGKGVKGTLVKLEDKSPKELQSVQLLELDSSNFLVVRSTLDSVVTNSIVKTYKSEKSRHYPDVKPKPTENSTKDPVKH